MVTLSSFSWKDSWREKRCYKKKSLRQNLLRKSCKSHENTYHYKANERLQWTTKNEGQSLFAIQVKESKESKLLRCCISIQTQNCPLCWSLSIGLYSWVQSLEEECHHHYSGAAVWNSKFKAFKASSAVFKVLKLAINSQSSAFYSRNQAKGKCRISTYFLNFNNQIWK